VVIRKARLAIAGVVLVFIATEIFCRVGLGLGDPPLSQADPQIEYLFRPSQTCHPLHHLLRINQWSMRSDDFPAHKSRPDELRVMVVGDSVVYGGTQLDQRDICTEILRRRLAYDFKRPVTVGNIAAKSWGPPNELAYLRRFGHFDADVVILVLNSHDYADVPTHVPVIDVYPDYPSRKPHFAFLELLHKTVWKPNYDGIEPARRSAADEAWALQAEADIYRLVRNSGAKIWLAQMRERGETDGHQMPGFFANREVARQASVPIIAIGDRFQEALRSGQDPYLDRIHPNREGCRMMANAMADAVEGR
jgi:hypothetical protein